MNNDYSTKNNWNSKATFLFLFLPNFSSSQLLIPRTVKNCSLLTRSEYIQSDISEDRNNNRWNLTSGQTYLAFPSPSGAPDPHPACQPNLFPIFEFSAYPRHVPKKSLLLSPILVLDRSAISAALNPVVRSLSNPFVSPRLLGYNKTFPFFSLHVYVDWPTFREFQILLCEGRGLFVPVELIFWYLYIYINWWPTWYANFEGQMYTTLLTMFSFFFFFLERRKLWNFYILGEIGREAMKFEHRWTRKRWAHLWFVCFFERIGRASYCTDRALDCLLYTLVSCVLTVTRTYLRGISRRWVYKPRQQSFELLSVI